MHKSLSQILNSAKFPFFFLKFWILKYVMPPLAFRQYRNRQQARREAWVCLSALVHRGGRGCPHSILSTWPQCFKDTCLRILFNSLKGPLSRVLFREAHAYAFNCMGCILLLAPFYCSENRGIRELTNLSNTRQWEAIRRQIQSPLCLWACSSNFTSSKSKIHSETQNIFECFLKCHKRKIAHQKSWFLAQNY